MWDGDVAWMPDGSISLYDDEITGFSQIGRYEGTDLCSMYDGNRFVLDIISSNVSESVDVVIGSTDILSGLVSATYSDLDLDYAMNAIAVPVRNGIRLSSEILAGGHVDVYLKERISGVKVARQGDGDCLALDESGIKYGSTGTQILSGNGIENILYDNRYIYFLSGGSWFSLNPDRTVTEFLSGTPEGDAVVGIGNSGNSTYVAAPDLYRIDYLTKLDAALSPTSRANISGIRGKEISPAGDRNVMVVSEGSLGEIVQSYDPETGSVGG